MRHIHWDATVGKIRTASYLTFLVALSIWVGGGVFDSIGSHFAWYSDPVAYVRGYAITKGTINPWPFTTAFLALTTLISIIVFARARVPGRRQVLIANAAVVLVLIATGVYFVPTLVKLGNHAQLTDASIITLSQTWVLMNLLRLAFLLALLAYALVALMRLSREPVEHAPASGRSGG